MCYFRSCHGHLLKEAVQSPRPCSSKIYQNETDRNIKIRPLQAGLGDLSDHADRHEEASSSREDLNARRGGISPNGSTRRAMSLRMVGSVVVHKDRALCKWSGRGSWDGTWGMLKRRRREGKRPPTSTEARRPLLLSRPDLLNYCCLSSACGLDLNTLYSIPTKAMAKAMIPQTAASTNNFSQKDCVLGGAL